MSARGQNHIEEESDWMLVSPPRSPRSDSPSDPNRSVNVDDDDLQQQQYYTPANDLDHTKSSGPEPTLADVSPPNLKHPSDVYAQNKGIATTQSDSLSSLNANMENTPKQCKQKRSVKFLNSLRDLPSTSVVAAKSATTTTTSSSTAPKSLPSAQSTTTKTEKVNENNEHSKSDVIPKTISTIETELKQTKSLVAPTVTRTVTSMRKMNKKFERTRNDFHMGFIMGCILAGLTSIILFVVFPFYYDITRSYVRRFGRASVANLNNEISFFMYPELKLLDEELVKCIKRDNLKHLPEKGFICYEREKEWRKKFDRLKVEKNLDLARIIRQTKKQITLEMLKEANPMLDFDLILNQLEYFEYLDQRRKDATIDRLKAENFALRNRLSDRLSSGNNNNKHQTSNQSREGRYVEQEQNSLANVEFENMKLRRENEALKVSLGEKAGTVFVKQSLVLEKCERENSALKRFHMQVAQEVAKGLKQLNLHTIDAAALLNDHESLDSQLALTRGYLLRFGEEVGNLVARNKILMDELRETTQLVAARQIEDQSEQNMDLLREENITSSNNTNSGSLSSYQSSGAAEQSTMSSNCPNNHFEKSNWLMHRAKLREKLRKATGIDVFEKNIEHIIGHNKSQKRHQHHHHHHHNQHQQDNNNQPQYKRDRPAKVVGNKHSNHHHQQQAHKSSEQKRNHHNHHHYRHLHHQYKIHRFRDEL